jgi:hypothetical protein
MYKACFFKVDLTKHRFRYLGLSLSIVLVFHILGCEPIERFYRPDVPQKLSTIGIIDVDDTLICDAIYSRLYYLGWYKDTLVFDRFISFEKSFQFEYPEEVNDSLKDFSFKISSESEDIFNYQSNHDVKSLELILPKSLNFESGRRYTLRASEQEVPEIYAESEVPPRPSELCLLSIKTESQEYFTPLPNGCYIRLDIPDPEWSFYAFNSEIEFSFPVDNPNSYYAVLLIGSGLDSTYNPPPGYNYSLQNSSGFLDFNVIETNTDGFFYTFQGRQTIHQTCRGPEPNPLGLENYRFDQTKAYYIDGSKIPGQLCSLKISTQFWNGITTPDRPKTFTIRLVSIPRELYFFEKSLYTYNEVSDDPFAEPANLKGNIKGGNGIFAICRSRDLVVYNPRW